MKHYFLLPGLLSNAYSDMGGIPLASLTGLVRDIFHT